MAEPDYVEVQSKHRFQAGDVYQESNYTFRVVRKATAKDGLGQEAWLVERVGSTPGHPRRWYKRDLAFRRGNQTFDTTEHLVLLERAGKKIGYD